MGCNRSISCIFKLIAAITSVCFVLFQWYWVELRGAAHFKNNLKYKRRDKQQTQESQDTQKGKAAQYIQDHNPLKELVSAKESKIYFQKQQMTPRKSSPQ